MRLFNANLRASLRSFNWLPFYFFGYCCVIHKQDIMLPPFLFLLHDSCSWESYISVLLLKERRLWSLLTQSYTCIPRNNSPILSSARTWSRLPGPHCIQCWNLVGWNTLLCSICSLTLSRAPACAVRFTWNCTNKIADSSLCRVSSLGGDEDMTEISVASPVPSRPDPPIRPSPQPYALPPFHPPPPLCFSALNSPASVDAGSDSAPLLLPLKSLKCAFRYVCDSWPQCLSHCTSTSGP